MNPRSRPPVLPVVLCALLLLVLANAASAAPRGAFDPADQPRLVRLNLPNHDQFRAVLESGVDIVHTDGLSVDVLEWPGDAPTLATFGVPVVVLEERPGERLAARAAADPHMRPRPAGRRVTTTDASGRREVQVLPPFGSGSLAGYWNPSEVRAKLDDLVASDTQNLVADKLDTIGTTYRNRPILSVTLGSAVPLPDTRPVVFIGGVMHAREPMGMQSVFYFADQLLAGYGVDPFCTYLLEHRRIVLVPVGNPDGYAINDSIYVASSGTVFGYWRKNGRDNDNNGIYGNGDGVDLNRNFGWKWGLNNVGSSPTMSSQTYRGPAAFSEPETRAQRDLVIAKRPVTGISFHSFGDYHLHPWGYTPAAPPDSVAFYEWNDEMTLGNGYISGPAPRILYEVNGEFNDWCYGDTTMKPRAYTWTPEIGGPTDDFWPPPSRILPLAKENLRTCFTLAAIAGPYVRIERHALDEAALNAGYDAHLAVCARNLGLAATPPHLRATLSPLDAGVQVLSGAIDYPSLLARQSGDALAAGRFRIAADDSVTPGRLVRFLAEFTADSGYYSRDTVEILCGTPTVVLAENGAGALSTQWNIAGPWGLVANNPAHPSRFIADSPSGLYANNSTASLTLRAPLDLTPAVHAWVLFDATWMYEQDYDCAVIEASLDSVTWTALAGRATTPGLAPQPVGKPVYEGTRWNWKPERVDLSAFAGPTANQVRLRLRSLSDPATTYDGFNFDTLVVVLYDPANQPAPLAVEDGRNAPVLALATPVPNPLRDASRFAFTLPAAGVARLELLDLQGRRVRTLAGGWLAAGPQERIWDGRDDRGVPVSAGVYFARLVSDAGAVQQRVLVLH